MKIKAGKTYLTRDSHKVRVVCTDANNEYPIIGLLSEDRETVHTFTKFGKYNRASASSGLDLIEEYSPWNDVEIDTKVLVKNDDEYTWKRRYFAKYENDKVYTFADGSTSWSNEVSYYSSWNYAKLAEEDDG